VKKSRFISRRALLRAIGASPIAGIAISAAAQEEIKAAASQVCGEDHVDSKFETVSKVLWQEFLDGVLIGSRQNSITPPMEPDPGVFKRAFELSGQFVVTNLGQFPADGRDPATVACCGDCGIRAVKLAHDAGATSISPAVFEQAWCATRDHFKSLFERKARYEGAGKDAEVQITSRAMGCG
jgi:hypothetical protein